MKFFTDRTVKNDYFLIHLKKYIKLRKKNNFKQWKEVYIDPGVIGLKKHPTLPIEKEVHIHEFLDSLPSNHFLSMDFPSDMNMNYKNLLLEKSWQYAQAYCYHPQFIVTLQFIHNNYWSFREWFDKYNNLTIKSNILGIGNLCRQLQCNDFMKHVIPHIMKYSKYKKIHIYGLSLKNIPITNKWALKYGIELSMDSTKWTRACNKDLKDRFGVNGGYNRDNENLNRKEVRQLFFDTYLETIRSRGIIVNGK